MADDSPLLRRLLDRLPEGILLVEARAEPTAGRVVEANAGFARLAGREAGALLGADPLPLVAELLDRVTGARLRNALRQEQPFRGDATWAAPGIDPLPVEVTVSPLDPPGTRPAHWLWQVRDISERKQLERQIWQAQRIEAVGQLARGLSHDFNNILTALSGYTSFLLQGIPYDDPLRADALEIEGAARKAALLIDQLLALSRREGIRNRLLDVNGVVAAMLPILERLAGEHIHVVTDLGAVPGGVLADERQLQQVIINLVSNARDAMPDGGTITISTAGTYPDQVMPGSFVDRAAGAQVLLTVADSGTGMTPDTKARLFEPFFTTKSPEEASGMGLATVYGIVRQLGGYVWVQSDIGHGTAVRLYLPVAGSPTASTTTELDTGTAGPAMPGGSELILLVEDDPAILHLVRRLLEGFGYRVLPAGSAAEATALAAEHGRELDLLVTDVIMPGQRGPDLAEELLADHPDLRVLCVSGHVGPGGQASGPSRTFPTLAKPFTAEELARKVRQVLDEPNPPA